MYIDYEVADKIATITLNRPEAAKGQNPAFLDDLDAEDLPFDPEGQLDGVPMGGRLVGVLGGVRATLFAGLGGAYFEGTPFKFYRNDTTLEQPVVGYDNIRQEVIYGPAVPVSGLRLVDGRGSYGISLATFALGFPDLVFHAPGPDQRRFRALCAEQVLPSLRRRYGGTG